jgi:hypothetical protein
MSVIGIIFIGAYLFAWWAVFWMPAKKENVFRHLAFIPATVFAFLPIILFEPLFLTGSQMVLFYLWGGLPFLIVIGEICWKRKKK